jgi:SAM-dependent methyltransferase
VTAVFNSAYAEAYDAFYLTKDYVGECDLLEQVFRDYGDGTIKSVLDLGCGTGNHALKLYERGYEVIGVDSSAAMLAQARGKIRNLDGNRLLSFKEGDIRNLNLDRQFDIAVAMFAVIGYQLENADVLAMLKSARRHLRTGGLLIFDAWYGPAVLMQRPSQTIKIIPIENGEILRASRGELQINRQLCKIDILVWKLEGNCLVSRGQEHHSNRYFFPLELELFLQNAGFSSLRLGAFPNLGQEPDETTWNVLQIAKAV